MKITFMLFVLLGLTTLVHAQPKTPTLFIIGDSTVKTPTEGQQGWGDPIAELFDQKRIRVENRARGGRSSRTFQTEGLWDQVLSELKAGDYVLMQFGHNDASPVNDNSRARGVLRGTGPESQEVDNQLTGQHETVYTYGAYLRGYIAEIRAVGATPVVCSPVIRKRWEADGLKVQRAGGNYAAWAAEVAKQEGVAFIDLNAMSQQFYAALGPERSQAAHPLNNGKLDNTHHNNYGAAQLARLVALGLSQARVPVASELREDLGTIEPGNPQAPEQFHVAASPGFTNLRPLGD